jgi:hypothetical protein
MVPNKISKNIGVLQSGCTLGLFYFTGGVESGLFFLEQ